MGQAGHGSGAWVLVSITKGMGGYDGRCASYGALLVEKPLMAGVEPSLLTLAVDNAKPTRRRRAYDPCFCQATATYSVRYLICESAILLSGGVAVPSW